MASGCYSVSTVNKMGNKLRPNIGSSPAIRQHQPRAIKTATVRQKNIDIEQ